jgi:hypothetical protein
LSTEAGALQVEVNTELVEAIDEGMTRCSFFVHDAPAGTRTSLPGRTDLARDIAKLREFEQATRDRSGTQNAP